MRPLSRAGVEPVERTFYLAVWLVHTVMRPLTRRDWRDQERVPPSGGAVFSAGSMNWPMALPIDEAASRITANVLRRFLS